MDRLGGFFGSRDAEDHLDDDYVEDGDADLDPPPSPVGQDERRMQVRAYNHWASLLGDLNFPHIDDLEPEALDDFGPYSVLLDLSQDIDDPHVRFVGSELAAECDLASGQTLLSNVPGRSVLSRITDHYMQILANQAPIGFEAEFVNDRGTTVLYRGILLPYSADNQTIDFIFGVINWKEMADQQTADELLLAIDQALAGPGEDDEDSWREPVATAESLTDPERVESQDDILELGNEEMMDQSNPASLPLPAFGQVEDEHEESAAALDASHPAMARADRSVDALGNPIGGFAAHDEAFETEDDYDRDTGMKTAADYGLPDWDDEDIEDDDVDAVVDPLADDETSSSLISLVSRGGRAKKSVDLTGADQTTGLAHDDEGGEEPDDDAIVLRIPEAYEAPVEAGPEDGHDAFDPAVTESLHYAADGADADEDAFEADDDGALELDDLLEPATGDIDFDSADEAGEDFPAGEDERSPEGLYDCLAAAREMAQTAQNTEDRSRKALYTAVARAYDFSLEAQSSPDDYDELLVDNGLTFQDRAPMTPIVKLVFGADYDKTRLTEYAAVLMYAHRVGVERGTLSSFLREAEGGLKGIVNAERRARKEEQGKEVADDKAVRPNLARKLRKLEALSLADLDEEGAEFALVMVRRMPDGTLDVLGEVPEDIQLVERAARKLLG